MPRLPLTFGSHDPLVIDCQNMAKALGADPGPIDGVLGPKTLKAVNKLTGDALAAQEGRALGFAVISTLFERYLREHVLGKLIAPIESHTAHGYKTAKTALTDAQTRILRRLLSRVLVYEDPIGSNRLNAAASVITEGYYNEDTLVKLGHPAWCGLYASWLHANGYGTDLTKHNYPWGKDKRFGGGYQFEKWAAKEKLPDGRPVLVPPGDVSSRIVEQGALLHTAAPFFGSLLLFERFGSGSDRSGDKEPPVAGKPRAMHVAVVLGLKAESAVVEGGIDGVKLRWVTAEGNVGDRLQFLTRPINQGALIDLSAKLGVVAPTSEV